MTRRTVMLVRNGQIRFPADGETVEQLNELGYTVADQWDTTPATEDPGDYFAKRHNDNVTSILAGKGPVVCIDDYRHEDGDQPA